MQAEFIMCMWLLIGRGDAQLTFFWEMAARDPSCVLAIISELLREDPEGAILRSGIINAVNNTVFARERDLKADLSDADRF